MTTTPTGALDTPASTHTTVLDAAQARLDALGALVESSRRDPASVGGPDHQEGHVDGCWRSNFPPTTEECREAARLMLAAADKIDAAATGCPTCAEWAASGGTAIM